MKRLVLIAAVVIPIIAAAWALPSDAHRGKRGWKGRRAPLAALELSAEQRTKLESLNLERAKKMAQLRADLKVARLDLRAAMRQDNPDPDQVNARVTAVNKARSLILESRVSHRLKVNGVLTPEQRNKLREMRSDRSKRGWGRMWRKGGCRKDMKGMVYPGQERGEEQTSSI
ncbi:MAG: Spy/CpxP family protein refolding chaperone [Gemmatimonadota bacterium]|nr:Spy/CpxP family protein refolding chaperone [Gemmatimonadota bacterium]